MVNLCGSEFNFSADLFRTSTHFEYDLIRSSNVWTSPKRVFEIRSRRVWIGQDPNNLFSTREV